MPTAELAFIDEEGAARLEPGEFDVYVGPSADPSGLLKATVRLSE